MTSEDILCKREQVGKRRAVGDHEARQGVNLLQLRSFHTEHESNSCSWEMDCYAPNAKPAEGSLGRVDNVQASLAGWATATVP
jgi:hypothetical protein